MRKKEVPCLALPLPSCRGEGRLVAFKRQKPPKEGLEGAQDYREIPKNTIFQKSDSEQFLFRKFYVGRGGSVRKNPPAAFFIFGPHLSPNGALRARPVKRLKDCPARALSNVISKFYV